MQHLFSRFANVAARHTGHPGAFLAAVAVILAWAATGPFFGFSDTWQLVINTGTTIVTFLMVFLIQNTQNRDSAAVQVKLDELIRAVKGARNSLINIEELTEDDLNRLRERYATLAVKAAETTEKADKAHGGLVGGNRELVEHLARVKQDLAELEAAARNNGERPHKAA